MHPTTLAARKATAINQIHAAAEALAQKENIDPMLLSALSLTAKKPEVKELHLLEGVGNLLTALAISANIHAPAEEPPMVFEPVGEPTVILPEAIDDLPEPVIEEAPVEAEQEPVEKEAKPKSRKKK